MPPARGHRPLGATAGRRASGERAGANAREVLGLLGLGVRWLSHEPLAAGASREVTWMLRPWRLQDVLMMCGALGQDIWTVWKLQRVRSPR